MAVLAICGLFAATSHALQIEGTVTEVVDGRTFVLKDNSKTIHGIILMGVETPEKGQPKHAEAVREMKKILRNRKVLVDWYRLESRCSTKPARDCSKVAKVLRSPDGLDPALHLLQRGLAWHAISKIMEQSTTDRRLYSEAEQISQFKRLGVWTQLKPEPPWEFRKHHKKSPEIAAAPSKSKRAKKKK
jgi:endonuclease YncB( thermonuclease family)